MPELDDTQPKEIESLVNELLRAVLAGQPTPEIGRDFGVTKFMRPSPN